MVHHLEEQPRSTPIGRLGRSRFVVLGVDSLVPCGGKVATLREVRERCGQASGPNRFQRVVGKEGRVHWQRGRCQAQSLAVGAGATSYKQEKRKWFTVSPHCEEAARHRRCVN